jgi:hypothetical protein
MKHGKDKSPPDRSLSRRQFLTGSAAGGLAAAAAVGGWLAGCGGGAAPSSAEDDSAAFDFADLYRHVGDIATGEGEFRGLAVSADGRILAAAGGGVAVFSPDGREVGRWPTDPPARCVAAAPDGSIWTAAGGQVSCFTADGRRRSGFSAAGHGAGRAPMIVSLAVGVSDLLLADVNNHRVRRFASDGDFIGDIGADGTGLVIPSPYMAVCLDAEGLLHVSHTGKLRIERYRLDGTLLDHWGQGGTAVGRFCGCCNPVGLCLAADGRVITAEKGLGRVTVFSPDHRPVSLVGPRQFSRASHEIGVAEDPAGRILVADTAERRIRIYQRA